MLAFLGNALIFLLMGVQIHPFVRQLLAGPAFATWLVALAAVGVVLLARFVLVLMLTLRSWVRLPRRDGQPILAPLVKQPLPRAWQLIVFWSGLRGALSLALVLALPLDVPSREVLVVSTFAVVLFTLLIQGLSIRWVLQRVRLSPPQQSLSESDHPTDEQVIVNSSPGKAAGAITMSDRNEPASHTGGGMHRPSRHDGVAVLSFSPALLRDAMAAHKGRHNRCRLLCHGFSCAGHPCSPSLQGLNS